MADSDPKPNNQIHNHPTGGAHPELVGKLPSPLPSRTPVDTLLTHNRSYLLNSYGCRPTETFTQDGLVLDTLNSEQRHAVHHLTRT